MLQHGSKSLHLSLHAFPLGFDYMVYEVVHGLPALSEFLGKPRDLYRRELGIILQCFELEEVSLG